MRCLRVHVLAVEVVELVLAIVATVEHNLTRPAGARLSARLGREHRAFDFTRVDALLNQHLPVVVGSFEHGGSQFGGIALMLDFRHTEA